MNICDIPKEVISDNILPFLHLNDLLRLRRVNRFAKAISEDYLEVHKVSTRRKVVINPFSKTGPRSLTTFLANGLPVQVTNFYIPTSPEVFSWNAMKEFAEKYGDQVHHLHLTHLDIPIVSEDFMQFFESLSNLAHLVIGTVYLNDENIDKLVNPDPPMENPTVEKIREEYERALVRTQANPCPVPSTFKNLKSIRVREYDYDCPNPESAETIWYFIEGCYSKQLETVEYPYDQYVNQGETIPWDGPLGTLMSIIKNRRKDFPTEPNLKSIDMLGLEYKERPNPDQPTFRLNSSSFYELITLCTENGNDVKLENVDGNFIDAVMLLDNSVEGALGCVEKINKTVTSVRYVGEEVVKLELPLLEKIKIPDDKEWGLSLYSCCMPSGDFQRPEWSNLKRLELHMSGRELAKNIDGKIVLSKEILDFFFVGIKREKMEQLEMGFEPNYHMRVTKDENIPFPKMKDVMDSCPNLKILKIAYWPGRNKAISMLWKGLPLLEEVTLDSCKHLGNVAFVGADKDKPTFLELKNLKRVRLNNLEMMPKVTDTLFTVVFRHMRLTKLNLTSNSPINSITPQGIKSLLAGEFSQSIESFPLAQLKMKNVTKEHAKSLESLFRTSQMH